MAGSTLVGCAKQSGKPQGPRPNIIFILIDTLRADRLGAYGSTENLTPVMDRLASNGVLFERANAAAPWTLPSMASLFSGFYPGVHHATDYKAVSGHEDGAGEVRVFSEQFDTLAERLRDAGYDTAAFVANPFIIPRHGFAQGFDRFDHRFKGNTTPGKVLNDLAARWIQQRDANKPFFLYIHYMDPHAPYSPYRIARRVVQPMVERVADRAQHTRISSAERNEYRNYFRKSMKGYSALPLHKELRNTVEYWRARYDAGVRQTDMFLADLRRQLGRAGVWKDALVVVTADHGEALGEHRLWSHGMSAYQNQLHVPLILRWPDHFAPMRIHATVRMFDVTPTILDYLELGSFEAMQAESLRSLIDGTSSADRTAFAEAVNKHPDLRAVILGDWKLLADVAGEDPPRLFNLAEDPGELRDLADAEPERVKTMLAALGVQTAENRELGKDIEVRTAKLEGEDVSKLRDIGYAGGTDDGEEDAKANDHAESQPADSRPAETQAADHDPNEPNPRPRRQPRGRPAPAALLSDNRAS